MIGVNILVRLARSSKRDEALKNSLLGCIALLSNKESVLQREKVSSSFRGYDELFAGADKDVGRISEENSIKKRKEAYQTIVDSFYDLVTDFYEYGWGRVSSAMLLHTRAPEIIFNHTTHLLFPQSFHFAPRWKGETFSESLKRLEYYLALRTCMGPTTKALDLGSGVGGPMLNIHRFTGADMTGVTINEYQVKLGNQYCAQIGAEKKCRIVQGDFQKLGEVCEPDSFDVALAIEATCHSPDRVQCFSGVAKALKKGGVFAGYEWVVMPEKGFDINDKDHLRIKEGIEIGNGLPTLATASEIVKALKDSGFQVLEAFDANENMNSKDAIPWYQALDGSFTVSGFRMTRAGRICTHAFVSVLELLRIAPKGTTRVSSMLNETAVALVEGGKKQIFTPSFFFLAVKK